MVIKATAGKVTDRLLGVQIVGYEGVDKRADVFILINAGFKKVYNLSGGHKFYNATKKKNK